MADDKAPEIILADAQARIEDTATYPADKTQTDFYMEDIVSHGDFLAALANKNDGPKNLSSLWEHNLTKLVDTDYALEIAENRSSFGLAATTLQVETTGKDNMPTLTPVHIIVKDNKGLIVGERIPSQLSAAFRKAGITYVDRTTKIARAKTQKALKELTEGTKEFSDQYLSDAFKYRNDVDSRDERPLSDLLIDRKIEPIFPKFPVRNSKPAV